MTVSRRQIWVIAYPIMLSLLMEYIVGLTDAAFLGRVGEVELGAVGLAAIFYMTLFMVGMGFSVGLQIIMARRNGEGNHAQIGPVMQQGVLFLILLAAVLFFVSQMFSEQVLQRILSSAAIYEASTRYLSWRVYGFFFAFALLVFRAFYVSITRTRVLTYVSLAIVLTNILLDYLLIFGKWGFPEFGIEGAAIASVIAEAVGVVFFLLFTYAAVDLKKYALDRWARIDFRLLGRVLGLSSWTMVHYFVGTIIWFIFFLSIEHLGERPMAVTNIVRSLCVLLMMIPAAYGSAVASLTGNLMGQGNLGAIMPMCRRAIGLCALTLVPIVPVIAALPGFFLRIFTSDTSLISASMPSLWVMLSCFLLATPAALLFNVITGAGNTRMAFFLELAAMLCYVVYIRTLVGVMTPPTALCWTADHVYWTVLWIVSVWYLKRAAWQKRKV